MKKADELLHGLALPPAEYRPTYFWSWNDVLEKNEIKSQISVMKDGGLGGFFMHARPGLATEYMSPDWMDAIDAAIETSKQEDMRAWLYDEHGWPSGFCGGAVSKLGVDYQQKTLYFKEQTLRESAANQDNLIAVYAADGEQVKRITQIESGDSSQVVTAAYYRVVPDYVDVLDAKVIDAFIDTSYEAYKNKFEKDFSGAVPGIFTDEPQYACAPFPWSFILEKEYYAEYGEDLLDFLPLLYLQADNYALFRYRFWSLINKLFTLNYFKKLGDWCQSHNLKFTGHHVYEDCLADQMKGNAGVMPGYEYMQMPGTDWISRSMREPTTPKQASSVAQQLGKPRVLTEQFASCNWDVSLEELKWIADWNYVNGVNFLCMHLAAYSLRGLRKRDCPASLFNHNAWWEKFNVFTDYLARVSALLSGAGQRADILVLHPIKSAYIAFNGSNSEKLRELDNNFLAVLETLSGLHFDYHLGDEVILSRHGGVRGGKLAVGECEYSVVILPELLSIDEGTTKLLLDFCDGGGIVVSLGDFPKLLSGSGDVSGLLARLKEKTIHCSDIPALKTIESVLNEKNEAGTHSLQEKRLFERTASGILPRTSIDDSRAKILEIDGKTQAFLDLLKGRTDHVSVSSDGKEIASIHYYHKTDNDKNVYFFVNHDKSLSFDTEIALPSGKHFQGYNPETNEYFPVQCGENHAILYKFMPMQSLILLEVAQSSIQAAADALKEQDVITLKKEWQISAPGYNSFAIDMCRYRINDGEWSNKLPSWDVQYYLIKKNEDCQFELEFEFEIDESYRLKNELQLGVEVAGAYESILINGHEILSCFSGSRIDPSIKLCDIGQYIRVGCNKINLRREFRANELEYYTLFGDNVHSVMLNKLHIETETENLYLFGDFGVYSKSEFKDSERSGCWTKGPFYLGERPESLPDLDLIKHGFLFYNDVITVEQKLPLALDEGKRYIVRIPRPNATAVEIIINGQTAATRLWEPYSIDVTQYLLNGENTIALRLYTSNRNLFGPFHHKLGQLHWTPWHMQINPKNWLFCEPEDSYYVPEYCFYRNGIIS